MELLTNKYFLIALTFAAYVGAQTFFEKIVTLQPISNLRAY